ncbi:unnamed protein product [Ectocarpus sp. 8 AP-2014]
MPAQRPIDVRVSRAATRLKSQQQGLLEAKHQARRDAQQREAIKYKALHRNQANAPNTHRTEEVRAPAQKAGRREATSGDATVAEAAAVAATSASNTAKPARREATSGDAPVAEAAAAAAGDAVAAEVQKAAAAAANADSKASNVVDSIVEIPRTLFTYNEESYSLGVSEAHDVAGDGNCFYHAVALILRHICREDKESSLCKILSRWVNEYVAVLQREENRKNKFYSMDSAFVRWMLLMHLDKAWNDDFFAKMTFKGTKETPPTREEMKRRLQSTCTKEGWGGMYESLLLTSALGGHVTVALMRVVDGVLTTDYVEQATPAKNFIFLEHHKFSHWKALKVVNFDSFVVELSKLEQYKLNGDFSDTDESSPHVAYDAEYLNSLKVDVTIDRKSAGGLDSIYRAVFNALNHLKLTWSDRGFDWDSKSNPLSERLRERFLRFQVVEGIMPTKDAAVKDAGIPFIRYLAGNAVGLYDIVLSIEKSLEDQVRINLHNSEGIMHRVGDANDRFRHARDLDRAFTLEIYLLLHGTPEIDTLRRGTHVWSAIKYEGGATGHKQMDVLVKDTDQSYVDEAGYTHVHVSGVISGIFDGVQTLNVGLSTPQHVMGFLGNIGNCDSKNDITEEVFRQQISVSQCGIEGPMLVDVNHNHLPKLTSRGLVVWKTLAGRQLDRYDLGSLLVRASLLGSKQQQDAGDRPLVTAFFMGNGPVFWKIVIYTVPDEKVMQSMHHKLNELGEFEKNEADQTHERPYYGLTKKLKLLVHLLRDIGTASVSRYNKGVQVVVEQEMPFELMSADWLVDERRRIEVE